MRHYKIFFLVLLTLLTASLNFAAENGTKKVLIVVQGSSSLKNHAIGDARQLATLMGHFRTDVTYKGVDEYKPKELNNYDYTFYIGFYVKNSVPQRFVDDVLRTNKPVIWMNTGMVESSRNNAFKSKYGFSISRIDSSYQFDLVKSGKKVFTKGEGKNNLVEILDRKKVEVLATAYATRKKVEVPYIVRSQNLLYVADSPFAYATETDRYLLFADMLHDILHENHESSHSAILRIEDINPTDSPDKIREVVDVLSERGIPFLVGVIPFYVNPGDGTRLSLSDKPDLVDALKYAVQNGGSIVMHGSTHQYRGITAGDFEFWDGNADQPIKNQTEADIRQKVEMGIQELMKNGLYPVAWETPHYTASFLLYKTVSKYFSTAVEQRLAIESSDYSQYFPYIINKDLFGQQIFPENLGYVPLEKDINISRKYVQNIIKGAKVNLNVRDGFAACFFHSFLDVSLLEELVDGVRAQGYTYIDLKDYNNWVRTNNRIVLTGSQTYSLSLTDQYLTESYINDKGEVIRKTISDNKLSGLITKDIKLKPGELYKAEPIEFREYEPSFFEKIVNYFKKLFDSLFHREEKWSNAHVAVLWNHYANGAAYNDQASLVSVFKSVNINVDTIFTGEPINLSNYNVLLVPYAAVDSLQPKDYDIITQYVANGGNIITDTKNEVAKELGIKFSTTNIKVHGVRDKYFMEEKIFWKEGELMNKFDVEGKVDEVFSTDNISGAPVEIGKQFGQGKVLFIGSRFDPHSLHGYSLYPFLMEHVRKYFHMRPAVRRDNLEVYFDPGFRHNMSTEDLIKQWVHQGIRIIHVAGWHEYPKYTYDYKKLIELAHANGILVYAWLEPPQVSLKFWQQHPEWREKNYKGENVRPSWRYPVALTDPECLKAMTGEFNKFLYSYQWDGVNLAELYFEAGKGLENPNLFTPMHPSAQKEFRQRYNLDLKKIFTPGSGSYWKTNSYVKNAVTEYRINKLSEIYDRLLGAFSGVARNKKGFQVIVTAMDSYGSPELKDYIGVDMEKILALQKKYNFLLQVEDPQNLWSTDPMRYVEIGKKYDALIGDSTKLLLDLNILTFRNNESFATPFPTQIQTGTESFLLVKAASLGAPRLTIYAESSVNPQDMFFLPYALASDVEYSFTGNGYQTNAPYSFFIRLPKDVQEILLDGNPIAPSRENSFLIPAGRHFIKLNKNITNTFSTHELQTRIMSFTGNILSVNYGMQKVSFEYQSEARTSISLNREPTSLKVDGKECGFAVLKGNDCYSIFLPTGRHQVELVAGNAFSYGINLTSLWSSNGIAIFGSIAIMMLLVMYFTMKIYKRKYR
ncbi:MAG: DUF2334 domain-containing protein [Ignavibacteria bacterium]|jgi:uncharacterized protein YdaL|nr:DUF2334 domain-containing protein [Ignavibacteria bacterium]MCU7502341.1 DUF2334 domain-containing protein [Ignavibacteria bacterium]MCU7515094.1 DUF2334 domain-containing protein [Ignavibacteria bacterium]